MKAILIIIAAAVCASGAVAQTLPGGFVYLRDVDPSIIQDMRYATSNNFVGKPLSGYEAGECVVKREVGLRLKAVQQELAKQKLSLKMFDCYRPARASMDMVRWSRDGKETAVQRRYNPALAKADLVSPRLYRGLFRPLHRRRARSDRWWTSPPTIPPASTRKRTMPIASRRRRPAPRKAASTWAPAMTAPTLKANTRSSAITPEQRKWRNTLVAAMRSQGFVNYFREWWHFSLPGAGGQAYDFPIKRRN